MKYTHRVKFLAVDLDRLINMENICAVSGHSFEVTNKDVKFYEKMDVPIPTLCPDERQRKRMILANAITLYQRKCDATGKTVVSNYSSEKDVPIYDIEYWWSDGWDPKDYGRDFDFNRPFFEQFLELAKAIPRPSLYRSFATDENSDYTNYAGYNKDCYLLFDSDQCRECYYSYSINSGVNVVDCFRSWDCEWCYECVDCLKCYDSLFLQNCDNCSESLFLKNCIGCMNCFGCVNLRNKQYYYLNEKCTKQEYEEKIGKLDLGTHEGLKNLRNHFIAFVKKFPHKYMEGVHNENVRGNYLTNCKNAIDCFDSGKLWDCRYVTQAFGDLKDSMDCTEVGIKAELCYATAYTGYPSHNVRFCSHCYPRLTDSDYAYYCPQSSHLFGCAGTRKHQYCIFNKQYSKDEYEALKKKIIDHMKQTGEWGETFPNELSPFAYNETIAQEYYPLTKEEALKRGYRWKEVEKKDYQPATIADIPASIGDVKDSICDEVLACEECKKNYQIQKQELKFYQKMNIPVPKKCFECRHAARRNMRNPRTIWQRKCEQCDSVFQTTFSPDRPEKVYCEKCYHSVVD